MGARRGSTGSRRGRNCGALASCFGGSFAGLLFRERRSFSGGIGFCLPMDGATHLFGDIIRDRAGVSLFLRDAEAGQKVNNRFGLDFEFAGQFVDSDLIGVAHALRSGYCKN